MRYVEPLFRPPSEGRSWILQATLGCSWNKCTYCAMYRTKTYQVRPLADALDDIHTASAVMGDQVETVFVADGDALGMPTDHWLTLLGAMAQAFPRLRRVSSYAMASNVTDKSPADLARLTQAGLTRLYIGPESGDDVTLKPIAKGATFDDHLRAAQLAHDAGMELSVIGLLGAAGTERSEAHAHATAELVTQMDPRWFSALTTTIVPGTPLARQADMGRFTLPDKRGLLTELRILVDEARPTRTTFRTNHASTYLALAGELPQDRPRLLATIDAALAGRVALRPEWSRGL